MLTIPAVALGTVVAAALLARRFGASTRRVNAWWREKTHFEQPFRQVAAALDQVVWLTTPDKRETLYISPAYEHVFGRSCQSLYTDHRSFLEAVHPDDRARVAAAPPEQIAGRWDEHYRIVRPDGAIRWIRSRAFPIRDATGQVCRIAGIAEDVTERREAEAAVARYVSVLRATLEAVADGLVAVDPDGRVECFNEPFAAMLGLGPAAVEAHDGTTVVARLRALLQAPEGWSLTTSPPPSPHPGVIEFTDGRVFDVSSQPRRIGARVAGRVWSFHEVTDEYRSAQLLRESEEKFWKAFRSNPDAVCIATVPDGRLLEVNERFADLTGFARDEVLGRAPSELGIWAALAERDEFVRTLAAGRGARDFECHVRRKTGEVRTALLSAEFIDLDGVPCTVGIARDITERKHAEEQLRNLALRLQEVREEERAGIAREIHDELGQVLTGLRIDLAWIAHRLPRAPHGLRTRIRAMVAQLDETVDAVQRISSELRPSVLDDLGLVAAIEWQAAEFERRTGIQCRLHVTGRRPELERQRATAVFRILQEALTNVARHAGARRLQIVLRVARGRLVLTVRDDGRGITEAEAASPQALGLVGMRERALAWDGELDVRGEPQRGTVVTLRLPLGRRSDPA